MVGLNESSGTVAVGAGKGPFLVAKQFAFQEILRDGRAINLDQGEVPTGAFGVQGLSGKFLACP
jgi:hypothetical protein